MSARAQNSYFALPVDSHRVRQRCALVGIVGGIAAVIGAWLSTHQFLSSYLLAYMLWLGVTLGCFALLMVVHLTGGEWAVVVRRLCEAASRLFPLMLLFFLPIVFGMRVLYPWARPEVVAADKLIQDKHQYLNPTGFILRAAVYFGAWMLLAFFLNRWSHVQDEGDSIDLRIRLQNASGAGLVIYGLTITFAAIDWCMSLLPHWGSTIYGLLFLAGEGISALAFLIIVCSLLSRTQPMAGVLKADHFHDLGKLLLAFVMLWAYFSFSQWLITWAGNLPEEILYYLPRSFHGWQWMAAALFVFGFAIPFFALLSRSLKRLPQKLMWIAAGLFILRWLDLLWTIRPNSDYAAHTYHLHFSWMDIIIPIAMGGIWLAAFLWQLEKWPLLPLRDPQLSSVLIHHVELEQALEH